MSDVKLLTMAETCELLSVGETTVKRWAKEHLLDSVDENGELKFPEPSVMKYKEINDRLNGR